MLILRGLTQAKGLKKEAKDNGKRFRDPRQVMKKKQDQKEKMEKEKKQRKLEESIE